MSSRRLFVSLALATCALPACAHEQPPQAQTRFDWGGVHMVESIQDCAVNSSADTWVPTTPDELTVKVNLAISNASGQATTVFPDRLRLADTAINKEAAPQQAPQPVSIPAGTSRQIAVEFHGAGDFSCHDRFQLKTRGAIEEAGRPLAIAAD